MTKHLLEVSDLSVIFHTVTGDVRAVNKVNWHLDKGEVLAILGESGSGKSVSASAIVDLIDMPPGEVISGEIWFKGNNLLAMPTSKRREINGKNIAVIFQDPLSHLNPVYTVGWQIEEALKVHATDSQTAHQEMFNLLEKVGIPYPHEAAKKYPHQFSGGQRQRVMIAMALALRPDVLIADEPTTALDVTVQAQILDLLVSLQKETGMALLIITHDLGVVAEVADRVIVMQNGEVVESGSVREVYFNPSHAYTKQLIKAAPGKGKISPGIKHSAPLLSMLSIYKSFGKFQALKNINFDLNAGETIAIVGESGSGKSTTAKVLLRLEAADSGQVLYQGQNILALSDQELLSKRRDIQMVFQDPSQSLNPRMTVFELISEAWIIHPDILDKSEWPARVAKLLEQVGLSAEHKERYPHQFSGGQRQRIAIARALALEPKIIICDEAVSALDVSVQAQVISLLKKLKKDLGLSYIFIAHDLPVVRDFADRVIVMKDGQIVETGLIKDIFENPKQTYTQDLLSASLEADPDLQAKRREQRKKFQQLKQ